MEMSKPYCRPNNPVNNGNGNNIIIDFHECDYVHTHELVQTVCDINVLLLYCLQNVELLFCASKQTKEPASK
jgi:hypothetical protein